MAYTVIKVLNNNAVLFDDNGIQKIGTGNGLGFGKKPGNIINPNNISKIFQSTDGKLFKRLSDIVSRFNDDYYELVEKIIDIITEDFKDDVTDMLFVTLIDHINFAKERYDKGIIVPCPMKTEIKVLYPLEYKTAEKTVEQINKYLATNFGDDEVGLIALHFLNLSVNHNQDISISITTVSDIVKIIEDYFNVIFDSCSVAYSRLVIHLNFLSTRMLAGETGEIVNMPFKLNKSFTKARDCADIIADYIKSNFDYTLTSNELFYLAIHIQNCIANAQKKEEK